MYNAIAYEFVIKADNSGNFLGLLQEFIIYGQTHAWYIIAFSRSVILSTQTSQNDLYM